MSKAIVLYLLVALVHSFTIYGMFTDNSIVVACGSIFFISLFIYMIYKNGEVKDVDNS